MGHIGISGFPKLLKVLANAGFARVPNAPQMWRLAPVLALLAMVITAARSLAPSPIASGCYFKRLPGKSPSTASLKHLTAKATSAKTLKTPINQEQLGTDRRAKVSEERLICCERISRLPPIGREFCRLPE